MSAQSLVDAGWFGYAGWGDREADADFAATGGSGKGGPTSGGTPSGGGTSTQDAENLLIEELRKLQESFDPEAARRAAEEEWNPFFDELLQDYLTESNIGQERSVEDLASGLGLLGERRETYLGDIERESPRIQEQIGGRFADRGLYFGGEREEKQRIQLEKEKVARGDYEREYEYKTSQAELQQERYTADVERDRKQRERDLAKQRESAITGQVDLQEEELTRGY